MLQGLFKPGWQSSSVEKRLQAIEKMDVQDAANQGVFETLVTEDIDVSVRLAALKKLARPDALFQISQRHTDDVTREKAKTAYLMLIGPKSTLQEDEFRELLASHPGMKTDVAKLCPYIGLRSELLQDLSEMEQAKLIADVEYSETRRLIAERLSALESLEQARKLLKGKDKSAEKIIKTKLDILRAEEKQRQETESVAVSLCEKMEYLSTHEWQADFKGRYLACSKDWDSLTLLPSEAVLQRYMEAKHIAQTEFEQRSRVEEAHLAQEQLAKDLKTYCHKIASCTLQQLKDKNPSNIETLNTNTAKWEELAAIARPNLNITDQFLLAQKSLSSVVAYLDHDKDSENDNTDGNDSKSRLKSLKAGISLLDWPNTYPELVIKSALLTELDEQKQQSAELEKESQERLDKLHKKISSILGSARRGEISRAKRDLEASKKSAEHYSGKERLRLDDRLGQAIEAVEKMGDWKDFATEPKYIELCEAMEVLIGSKTHPDQLAVEINALQKRWKALGHSGSSDNYWERFKEAGDKAYEPCAAFFSQRRDTRKQNLQSREPLVEQTRELLENTDWDAPTGQGSPDYKQIELELRRISNEWQKVKDVEQRDGQKQWKRLSNYKSAIYEKLDVVYDANIALKNQLIEQAVALSELEAKEESLNTLKQLQMRWKQVGITRRKEDQQAWSNFKTATDNVYEKVQGIRKQKRADEDAQLDAYRKIIKQIRDLAKNATDLAEADSQFDNLEKEFEALPELPKGLPEKLLEGISSDFKKSKDIYATARDRIIGAAKEHELAALAKKAELCTELESLVVDGSEDIDRIKSAIEDITMSDKHLLGRFDQRLSSIFDTDREEANHARRMRCIDLEILLGVESAPEDKELRMKVQLERMKEKGIGQVIEEKETVLREIKLDWLCLPGAEPKLQKTLNKRFSQLIK